MILEKEWQPTPVFLPGEFHRQRSLVGYSPSSCKELDTTVVTEHTYIWYIYIHCVYTSIRTLCVCVCTCIYRHKHRTWGFPGDSVVKNLCQCRRCGFDLWVRKIPLEEEMATHYSILVWEIPWTEGPGGLQSMGSQRVGHYLATEHSGLQCLWTGKMCSFLLLYYYSLRMTWYSRRTLRTGQCLQRC